LQLSWLSNLPKTGVPADTLERRGRYCEEAQPIVRAKRVDARHYFHHSGTIKDIRGFSSPRQRWPVR
jgi:hypothetical protein